MTAQLLKLTEVADILGVSRWTVNRLVERDPSFPAPIRLSPRTPRWRQQDIDEYLELRAQLAEAEDTSRDIRIPQVGGR